MRLSSSRTRRKLARSCFGFRCFCIFLVWMGFIRFQDISHPFKAQKTAALPSNDFLFVGFEDSSDLRVCTTLMASQIFGFPLEVLSRSHGKSARNTTGLDLKFLADKLFIDRHRIHENTMLFIFLLDDVVFLNDFNPYSVDSDGISRQLYYEQEIIGHWPTTRDGGLRVVSGRAKILTSLVGLSKAELLHYINSHPTEVLETCQISGSLTRGSQFCFSKNRAVTDKLARISLGPFSWGLKEKIALEKAREISSPWLSALCTVQPKSHNNIYVYKMGPRGDLVGRASQQSLPTRVHTNSVQFSVFEVSEVKNMIENQYIKLPSWLRLTENVARRAESFREVYSLTDIAILVSHLTILEEAYRLRRDPIVVINEDLTPEKGFLDEIDWFIRAAPLGFEAVQLVTFDESTKVRLGGLKIDKFMDWFPRGSSSAGYLMTRQGMHRTLSAFDMFARDVHIRIPEEPMVVLAQEALYYNTEAYVAACGCLRWKNSSSSASTDHRNGWLQACAGEVEQSKVALVEPVLVFTTFRIRSLRKLVEIMKLVIRNKQTLSRYSRSTFWTIHMIVTDLSLLRQVKQYVEVKLKAIQGPTEQVFEVHFAYNPVRYNKFYFLRSVLPMLAKYKWFMLTDGDMHFAGYAWGDFLKRASTAVIAGTIHQSVDEELSKNNGVPKRQWFKIFEGSWWSENLPEVLAVRLPFVEQSFAMMDAQFAEWYFKQILTDVHMFYLDKSTLIPRQSDFGPDVLWCGAAAEWLRTKRRRSLEHPCVVVTLPMKHGDDRQIGAQAFEIRDAVLAKQLKFIERHPLDLYRSDFPAWFKYSRQFIKRIQGRAVFNDDFLAFLRNRALE